MESLSSAWMWIGFSALLLIALSIDTLLIGKYRARSNETWRAALCWSIFWVVLSLLFNLGLWFYLRAVADPVVANTQALDFLIAYLVEKSLSLDNLFVFYLVFQHFGIPRQYQHRVLSYGIWGAVILRLIVILSGIWLIAKFHWLLYLMGAFLFFTGMKIMLMEEEKKDFSETLVFRAIQKIFRVTPALSGQHFFIWKNKYLYATPLFITLVLIEISDLIFAVDSIPAVFSVTQEPFIVWSSNICAILGLRAMYFLLAKLVEELALLKYGIALILVYVGTKMLIEPWYKIPSGISLCVIVTVITIFSLVSYVITRNSHRRKR